VLFVPRPRCGVPLGEDPRGEVIHLVEALPAGHGELPGPPEVFQGCLVRLPPPPGLVGPGRALVLEVAGEERPFLGDPVAHLGDDPLRVRADPFLPPGVHENAGPVALEADFPPGIPDGRDRRGVVRPVLEEPAVLFEQPGEQGRPVALEPGRERQVMGPLDDVDRVDLDEPHPDDEVVEDV
jgi:hypothetical protein